MAENTNSIKQKFIIRNKLGLHARPAAMFVKLANTFQSEVWVEFEDDEVNGKSIMGLMMLAAPSGSIIYVSAKGEDAEKALLALGNLVEGGV
ncbi:MAG: HPr family phosphocarrier protein [Verrucomicrobiales bacterium]